jgi:hypothetical protein
MGEEPEPGTAGMEAVFGSLVRSFKKLTLHFNENIQLPPSPDSDWQTATRH